MLRWWAILLIVGGLAGCGQARVKSTIVSSEQSYQDGRAAFEQKNYAAAAQLLNQAVTQGGLNADLAADSYFLRAKSNVELDNLEEALRDLEEAGKGPIPAEEILVTKGVIARRQGDTDRANRLFEKARKQNPSVVLPEKG